jgi:glutaredoxin-related protein
VGVVFDALNDEILTFRDNFTKDKALWHPKIKSILNESQVVVFIKGTADAPKCGFTETMLKILEDHQISFTFYDILTD